ncbi:MAG: 1-(5-phosphoribosyl)-5-[(5-phosphoribosylamino)methylideneamino] imidazole-4-carboxamide isomerase [Anaerolineae bacterium]|jgi:phosphoribosylformimino-5-aminoimidazole carboxamide ribotide isomerase|nr:1-(5-phosphoribosyl)-5-[(5-phosphoribosylamino)methylideneamino] imidazole-4-carboxamide isomerase [Anaerolineae bacterium]
MIIYPAIDLRGGQVVRLRQGDPQQQTTFSADPLSVARQWQAAGAAWLHIVNLDGAFSQANDNSAILKAIARPGVNIQFGGGLRSLPDIAAALAGGAARVVLGTAAIENPALVEAALAQFGPEAICVALDARDGKIATRGWTTVTDETPVSLGRAMAARGVRHALFTDVGRDGGLAGSALDETIDLARQTGLQVIASGGVSRLDEITTLARSGAVAGAVIGMALYRGEMTLADALAAAQQEG